MLRNIFVLKDITGIFRKYVYIPGLFDDFVENVYKIVSVHSILIVFVYATGQYVYDRYRTFQLNILTRKNYTCFINIL